eukprot:m.68529 g.68529  ORF g.68529 m.68529 type:complete len:113 (-) comp7502_c0_seq2:153-491(-)
MRSWPIRAARALWLSRTWTWRTSAVFVRSLLNLLRRTRDWTTVLPILMACVDPDATQGAYYGPCGPFELWGGPVRVKPGAIALDSNLIEWLWEHSKTKTSCDPDAVITLARD